MCQKDQDYFQETYLQPKKKKKKKKKLRDNCGNKKVSSSQKIEFTISSI